MHHWIGASDAKNIPKSLFSSFKTQSPWPKGLAWFSCSVAANGNLVVAFFSSLTQSALPYWNGIGLWSLQKQFSFPSNALNICWWLT